MKAIQSGTANLNNNISESGISEEANRIQNINNLVLEVGDKVGETEGFSREVAQLTWLYLK